MITKDRFFNTLYIFNVRILVLYHEESGIFHYLWDLALDRKTNDTCHPENCSTYDTCTEKYLSFKMIHHIFLDISKLIWAELQNKIFHYCLPEIYYMY